MSLQIYIHGCEGIMQSFTDNFSNTFALFSLFSQSWIVVVVPPIARLASTHHLCNRPCILSLKQGLQLEFPIKVIGSIQLVVLPCQNRIRFY
jgi:hypothetical protein